MNDELQFWKERALQAEKGRNDVLTQNAFLTSEHQNALRKLEQARFLAFIFWTELQESLGVFHDIKCPFCEGDGEHTEDCPVMKLKGLQS